MLFPSYWLVYGSVVAPYGTLVSYCESGLYVVPVGAGDDGKVVGSEGS